jgi:hypothetical protein
LERGRRERGARRDRRGGGGGEESGDGRHLGSGQLADATGVVNLEASADSAGSMTTYSIKVCQGVLW